MEASRFDIILVDTLPHVVVSPNEMNLYLQHVIAAPMYEHATAYPTRVGGQIALEELRAIPKTAITQKMGRVKDTTARDICALLEEMFRY